VRPLVTNERRIFDSLGGALLILGFAYIGGEPLRRPRPPWPLALR
jgi:hypothetical protein